MDMTIDRRLGDDERGTGNDEVSGDDERGNRNDGDGD